MAARIAESHVDAVAILDELGGKPPELGQLWGVWVAESPDAVLTASNVSGGAYTLNGTKVWCSGAGFSTHALVTARQHDGRVGLFAVTVTEPAVKALPSTWWNAGMAGSDTRSVQFTDAQAVAVVPRRLPGSARFWHGAIGVAACWLGGARRVAEPLYRCAKGKSADAYSLAHLGAVDAALAASEAMLATAARRSTPTRSTAPEQPNCWRAECGRWWNMRSTKPSPARAAPWPGPLCQDGRHAQRVADLTIYIRQSLAERDLAEFGPLAGRQR